MALGLDWEGGVGEIIGWAKKQKYFLVCFDLHYKIKETLYIRDLKPAMNVNIGSENLFFIILIIIISRSLPIYYLFILVTILLSSF